MERVRKAGDIYKGVYEGLYCVGCEQFLRDGELVDGRCAEHGVAPEPAKEEWRLAKEASPEAKDRLATVLYHLVEALRVTTTLLGPFVPHAANVIAEQLGLRSQTNSGALAWGKTVPGTRIRRGSPLFPRRRAT